MTSNFPGINLFKAERVWGKNHFPFAGYLLLQSLQLIQSKLRKGRKGGRRKKRFWFAGILKSAIAAVQENWPKPNKLERICLLNENLICYLKYEVFQNSNGMLQEGRKGGRDKNRVPFAANVCSCLAASIFSLWKLLILAKVEGKVKMPIKALSICWLAAATAELLFRVAKSWTPSAENTFKNTFEK